MTDAERERILKNKQMLVVEYSGEADEIVSDNSEALKRKEKSVIATTVEKIKENFVIPDTMKNDDFEIIVTTTSRLFDESVSKVITDAASLVKLMPVLEKTVKNAVAIESHTNRYFYDNNTVYFLNMLGGYKEGDMFTPVRFGVKQATDGKNYLYVVIDNEKIEMAEITADSPPKDRSKLSTDSAKVSISKLLSKVNSPDILKYVPDGFLSEDKILQKYKAIADTIKYTNDKNDKKYRKFIQNNNRASAKEMIKRAAQMAGYTRKMFHETDAENIHIFDISRGNHGGTDSETPYGIFTKSRDNNIGLGSRQMELYVKADNTLHVKDRAEVKEVIPELVPYYDKIAEIDKHYDALEEKAEDAELDAFYEWADDNPDVDMDEIWVVLAETQLPTMNSKNKQKRAAVINCSSFSVFSLPYLY